ncbi:MAG: cobalt-precorrin-5B (C(1))-methyltransferase [Rickettsiales bacterium]
MKESKPNSDLRRGWTTGTCAAAAAKAAFEALITGKFPDMIDVSLPRGERPFFSLAHTELSETYATASVVKDAGDDPDVTHGAVITAKVSYAKKGGGILFSAGKGVGKVTKAGLPLDVGEPAINPMPRQIIATAIEEIAKKYNVNNDVEIEISVKDGEKLALKTLNPRLGILGGISILGTTGIVIPFSCSAWIHSIYRGIDVARAAEIKHVAGATGRTSELAVSKLYSMPEDTLIDMGDFVGGMLKYLRNHPIEKVTIAGGFGKMCKLAQGLLDLHSRAGSVDVNFLAKISGIEEIKQANTAKHALEIAGKHGYNIASVVAEKALKTAQEVIRNADIELEIVIFDRNGELLARV